MKVVTEETHYSMRHKGDFLANAETESFFNTLKVELIDGKTYNSCQNVKMIIFEYIEGFI